MDDALESLVRTRSRSCCEYCRLPEGCTSMPFEIDHIIAQQHGGKAIAGNLAFACFACNHHKGPNLGGIDPRSRKRVWLFNPRRQKWAKHFAWNGPVLVGRTAVGRATIAALAINLPHRVAQRAALMEEGRMPI